MKRTKKEAEQTREAILKAGVKVIYEKGFEATRLCDIAKEAGVTRGAIYWHFKNKIDLMKEMHNKIQAYSLQIVTNTLTEDLSIGQWIEKSMTTLAQELYENRDWWMIHYVLISTDWTNYLGDNHIEDFKDGLKDDLKEIIDSKLIKEAQPYTYEEIIFWMITVMTGIVSGLRFNRSEEAIGYIRNFMAVFTAGIKFSSPLGDKK